MLEFFVCGVMVLALATLYISMQVKYRSLFDKLCDWYIYFIIFHAAYAFVGKYFFSSFKYIDAAAPLGLAYGPFFYFGLKSLLNDVLDIKKAVLHFSPSVIFAVLYFILLGNSYLSGHYMFCFFIILYSLIVLSMLGYAFWGTLFFEDASVEDTKAKQMLKTSGLWLVVIALLFLSTLISRISPGGESHFKIPANVIYGGMFISTLLVFKYRIDDLIFDKNLENMIEENKEIFDEYSNHESNGGSQKYSKSAVRADVFEDYRLRLEEYFIREQVYLQSEINLESLAKSLKMSKHHLTQLFNVYIGENFNQFVNRYRVDYACKLLLDERNDLTIEEIAFESGFNSKVSFNRHFKNFMGCTPSEYIKKVSDFKNKL